MRYTNRLIHEKSPYLLQHAHNPVDWYPWSDEAFQLAANENKPVFLSIGYAACHWCHVMARESFENILTAGYLNDTFVCIKVDREERPDIDSVYMHACQMLTGRGGWPLTILMTPEKQPFHAATYIPPTDRFGQTGLIELCRRIQRMWLTDRGKILQSAAAITHSLKRAFDFESSEKTPPSVLDDAYRQLERRFDARFGGFFPEPKFPLPHRLMFLLRYHRLSKNPLALEMVEKTLTAMRLGGIWDHVGFGFHRYSTDSQWLVPHFEKMLYDQAMTAIACLETFQVTSDEFYAQCAREIFCYVLRDLTSADGAFFAAEDADSEGEEGRFYVWRQEEVCRALGETDFSVWKELLNLEVDGNYLDESTGRKTQSNILHFKQSLTQWAGRLNMEEIPLQYHWTQIRERLYKARCIRPRPLKDDKVLTDWNGLMICALSMGGRILNDARYVRASQRAAAFILTRMQDDQGRLLHRFRENDADVRGNANDYACFIMGLVQLYQSTFDPFFLKQAVRLQDIMLNEFWDSENGGFYLTSSVARDLPVRPRELVDGPIPSANSAALVNLLNLSLLTGDPRWENRAHHLIRSVGGSIQANPSAHTHFLIGLDLALNPGPSMVIAGEPDDEDTRQMLSVFNRYFLSNSVILLKSRRHAKHLIEIAPFTGSVCRQAGKATAFVCRNFSCHQPTTDLTEFQNMVSG